MINRMLLYETVERFLWRCQVMVQQQQITMRMVGSSSTSTSATTTISSNNVSTCNTTSQVAAMPPKHENPWCGSSPSNHINNYWNEQSSLRVAAAITANVDDFETANANSIEIEDFLMNHHLESVESLEVTDDEPNLYHFPSTVCPSCRTIPLYVMIFLAAASYAVATTFNGKEWKKPHFKWWLTFFVTALCSTAIVQDLFFAPSRLPMSTLLQNHWLPSPLSKYSIVTTSVSPSLIRPLHDDHTNGLPMVPVGVHYLEYSNHANDSDDNHASTTGSGDEERGYAYDAIHFNHGFGASSLSWLPAIPSLTKRLNARVGLAHDAPGFGFTDRPTTNIMNEDTALTPYSSAGNAALGNAILMNTVGGESDVDPTNDTSKGEDVDTRRKKRVALFGHSMGAASTLKMALTLPSDIEKTIVLVAPALVGNLPNIQKDDDSKPTSPDDDVVKAAGEIKRSGLIYQRQPEKIRRWVGIIISALRRVVFDPVIMYMLKRAVG